MGTQMVYPAFEENPLLTPYLILSLVYLLCFEWFPVPHFMWSSYKFAGVTATEEDMKPGEWPRPPSSESETHTRSYANSKLSQNKCYYFKCTCCKLYFLCEIRHILVKIEEWKSYPTPPNYFCAQGWLNNAQHITILSWILFPCKQTGSTHRSPWEQGKAQPLQCLQPCLTQSCTCSVLDKW